MVLTISYTAQLFPAEYTINTPTSVNGSSATGNCANITNSTMSGTLTCADPTSSVLFDDPRGMPILTGLDGDMWASQLLTIQGQTADIHFDFVEFTRVERFEVVMFNCPQWGIGAQRVFMFVPGGPAFDTGRISITSCTSLVRVCLQHRISEPAFALQFIALLEAVGYINNAHLSLCLKWFLSAVEYHKKGCQALIVLDALQWATVKGGNRNGNKS